MKLLKEILFGFLLILGICLASNEPPLGHEEEWDWRINLAGVCLMVGASLVGRGIE